MRILICAQQSPNGPVNGFRVHLTAAVDALSRKHVVRVLAPGAPEAHAPWDAPQCYGALAERLRPALHEELDTFAPDLVYVAGVWLAQLGRDLGGRPCVIAPLDAAHLSAEARALAMQGAARRRMRAAAARMRRFEGDEYARFDRVLVLSERDRAALHRAGLWVQVIPHPVDVRTFTPRTGGGDRRRIVFAGVMSAAPNVTAAEFLVRHVLPRVRARVSDASVAIVGRDLPPRLTALDRLPGVRIVGEVRDMAAWLASSRVCVAPMLTGSGVKNKLLEGMASGLPCVVTPLALGGLRAVPGRDLLVGATAEELAAQLVRVLEDDQLAANLGAAARDYVVAHHGLAGLAAALERIVAELTPQRSDALVTRLGAPSVPRSGPRPYRTSASTGSPAGAGARSPLDDGRTPR